MKSYPITTPIWVLDFESSGLSTLSYPIEVGIAGNKGCYSSLICQEELWTYWSEDSEAVHGISVDELTQSGQSAIAVAKELNQILDGSTVYTDCKKWDQFWLDVLFDQCGIIPTFKLSCLSDELSETQGEKFLTAYEKIQKAGAFTEHRALDDATLIYKALIDIGFGR